MDAADEMDVFGQLQQDALAAVGAVAGDDDFVVGEPGRGQFDEFDGQLRAGAMVGIGLGLFGFGSALLAFREPLAIAVEPCQHGQREDFGRSPERVDDEDAEHDPVMAPTDQRLFAAGDERIVVHAGAVDGQSSSATECVIDGPKECGARREDGDDELGEYQREGVEIPRGMAEEAVKPTPMSIADVAAGEDDFGDEAMSLREDPASNDLDEGREGGSGEDRGEIL